MSNVWADPALAAARPTVRRRPRASRLVLLAAVVWVASLLDLLDARGVALVVGALVAIGFLRLLVAREAAGSPGPFSQAASIAHPPDPPSGRLSELQRLLDLATVSAGDAHHVLRPLVADIAGTWLEARHGIRVDDPRAASLLAPDVWALASPAATRPADPHLPGPTSAELDRLISHLESLR